MSLVIAPRLNAEDTARSADQAVVSQEIARAEAHWARRLRGRLRDATISLQHDGVILRGRTNTYYVKQLAQHSVMKLVSVPIAANEIEVVPLPSRRRP